VRTVGVCGDNVRRAKREEKHDGRREKKSADKRSTRATESRGKMARCFGPYKGKKKLYRTNRFALAPKKREVAESEADPEKKIVTNGRVSVWPASWRSLTGSAVTHEKEIKKNFGASSA